MFFKKLSISLTVIFLMIIQPVSATSDKVYLGGQSIGIELDYEGIMITGTYDIEINNKLYNPANEGFKVGDIIIQVNNSPVKSISELMEQVEKYIQKNQSITLTLKRNNQTIAKELLFSKKDGQFSTGLYIQDGLTGVGTMTYYDPSNQTFGALGHIMEDSELSYDITFQNGKIYHSYVKKIIPSKNGEPGSKIAQIGTIAIGQIYTNNSFGIYGKYSQLPSNPILIETSSIDEVKKGKAYFYTVLEGHTITKCEIEITHLKNQKEPKLKGITFKIVDKEILKKTNGVIQGMSGSPIVQNGKLIGCVTHVDISDVTQGYGLYIDWMLENSKS